MVRMRKTTKYIIHDDINCNVDLTQGTSRIRTSNSDHSAVKFDNAVLLFVSSPITSVHAILELDFRSDLWGPTLKTQFLWDVNLCRWVCFSRSFDDSQYLYFDLKMEMKQSSETSRATHLLTRPHTQEELNFHIKIIFNRYFLGVVSVST